MAHFTQCDECEEVYNEWDTIDEPTYKEHQCPACAEAEAAEEALKSEA